MKGHKQLHVLVTALKATMNATTEAAAWAAIIASPPEFQLDLKYTRAYSNPKHRITPSRTSVTSH